MNLCKLAKIVLLITLVGLPLSLVFGGGVALILSIIAIIYAFEDEKSD